MATTIGEAIIKLAFDTKELDKGQQEVAGKVNKILGGVASVAKTGGALITAGITAASSAVATTAGLSVKAYAEYEQLQGGVETLFKESSDQIMGYAQNAYETAGLSASQYMEQATSFASRLIRDTGGDTARAAELVDIAIKDMSDNANKMGTSIDAIQAAYQGLSKGNATMLDNLKVGYGGTQTEMLKLAKDMGVVDQSVKSFNDISFEDSIMAIHKVQEQLGITGTTAKEATATISGSMNMAKKAAQDLITGLANPTANMDSLIDNLLGSVDSMLNNLGPAITNAMNGIQKLIEKGLPKLLKVIPKILKEQLPRIIEMGVKLFNTIMDYLPELTQMLIDLLVGIAQAIIPQLPTLLLGIVQGIIGVIKTLTSPENLQVVLQTAIQLLMALVEAVPDILVALIEALPDIIVGIVEFLTDPANIMIIIEAAVKLFMGLVAAVPKILGALFKAFGDLFGKLWERCSQLFKDFAAHFGEAISGVFKAAVNGVLWFIESFINGPIDIINFFIDGINGILGLVSGGQAQIGKLGHVSLPRLAEGGVVAKSTLANIGEDGKEAVIPLERNTDNWAGLLAHTLADEFEQEGLSAGGNITVYMTNNINNNLDADEIGQRLMTSIRRAA